MPPDSQAAVIRLRAESVVRGPEMRLGELGEISTPDETWQRQLEAIDVGRAPLPGASRTVDLPYLAARLKQAGVDPARLRMEAPARVTVTTKSRRIPGAELVEAVRAALLRQMRGRPEDVAVEPLAPPADFTVAEGAVDFAVRFPGGVRPEGGVVAAAVEVRVDGTPARVVSVPVRLAMLEEVLVAVRPVGRQAVLTPDDVRLERRAILPGQEPFRDAADLRQYRTLRSLARGEVVLRSALDRPPAIRRGEVVLLTAERLGLRAVTRGEAREDGRVGQVIRVRNLASGREVYGLVGPDREVRVAF
jgi:flagella basal body P-ring formation protein FlgA